MPLKPLPPEILYQIIDAAVGCPPTQRDHQSNKRTVLALSQASKQLRSAAEPHLYSTVCLSLPARAESFSKSILPNSDRLQWVEYLWLGKKAWYDAPTSDKLGLSPGSSLPPVSMPLLREAAWLSGDEIFGGFLVGHRFSTQEEGAWSYPATRIRRNSESDRFSNVVQLAASMRGMSTSAAAPKHKVKRLVAEYHLITPTLTGTFVKLLARIPTILELSITLYPGPGAVLDDDELEYALRRILSPSVLPNLRKLTIYIAHDRLAVGSRIRRIDRSRTIIQCAERIDDDRVVLSSAGREFGTSGTAVAEDVVAYLREDWEVARASTNK